MPENDVAGITQPADSQISLVDAAQGLQSATPSRQTMLGWLLVFLALGILWRVGRYALAFPFWGDEAFILNHVVGHGYAELFAAPPEYFQVAPLGFLWLERAAFEWLGPSEYAMHLPSLVAGLAALLCFATLSWRLLPPQAAALAVGVFGASYPLVRHANESKPYGIDALIATLILLLVLLCRRAPAQVGRFLALGMLFVLAPWISYPSVFVAGGALLALMLSLRGRLQQLCCVGCGAALTLSFCAFYGLYARYQVQRSAGSWLENYWVAGFPPLNHWIDIPAWLLRVHAGEMLAYPTGGENWGSIVSLLLLIFGAVWMWREQRRADLALVLAPFALALLAAFLQRYPYGGSSRLAQHLAPGICVLIGSGAFAALRCIKHARWRDMTAGACGLLLIAIPLVGLARDIGEPFKTLEDRRARDASEDLLLRMPRGARVAVLNRIEYGADDDETPQFHPTIRYRLRTRGIELLPAFEGPLPDAVDWLLVYRAPHQPPQPADVAARARVAGLMIAESSSYLIHDERRASLHWFRLRR